MDPLDAASDLADLELRLVRLARAPGALRAALARVAAAVVERRAWEPLGYARLRDYAAEKLGASERHVLDLARVGRSLRDHPEFERALVTGELTFAKVRLLARVITGGASDRWLALARRLSADALSREVRRVDRDAIEGLDPASSLRRSRVEIRCSARVHRKWREAQRLCARMAGSRAGMLCAVEWVAAEVFSGLPHADATAVWIPEPLPPPTSPAVPRVEEPVPIEPAPFDSSPFLHDLEDADALALDDRLRALLRREQAVEAEIGPLLAVIWRSAVPRKLGYATLDAYALERLGLDPAKARALLRIERAAMINPSLGQAYRSGALSWVKAQELVPIVTADPEDRWASAWVERAREITVRDLRDDLERALDLLQEDPRAWREHGGLSQGPALPAQPDAIGQEIGATDSGAESDVEDCVVTLWARYEDARLFRAVLASVRRWVERRTGRLPTEGQALEVMLNHVLAEWSWEAPSRFKVFVRDDWRCVVPGCTSMRNLHDHHIEFRSQGGSDEPENRTTLCAWHHLRGVHAGIVGIEGRAPDALRFQLPG
jgi:hypothetical protein